MSHQQPKSAHTPTRKPENIITPAPEGQGTLVKFQLTLPEKLYDKIVEQGVTAGRTVEDEIAVRISRCQDHVAHAGLYFNDDQRRKLEEATGHGATNPDLVIEQVRHLISLTVGNVSVDIPPDLHKRIASRVWRGMTFESYLRKAIIEGLEREVGMR